MFQEELVGQILLCDQAVCQPPSYLQLAVGVLLGDTRLRGRVGTPCYLDLGVDFYGDLLGDLLCLSS